MTTIRELFQFSASIVRVIFFLKKKLEKKSENISANWNTNKFTLSLDPIECSWINQLKKFNG